MVRLYGVDSSCTSPEVSVAVLRERWERDRRRGERDPGYSPAGNLTQSTDH